MMRLYIHPGSLWLSYSVRNEKALGALLPADLALAPVSLLEGQTPQTRLLFNAYDVSSKWMRGTRVDIQTFARHRTRGTPHLVVLDCVSTALMWDPEKGVSRANADSASLFREPEAYHFSISNKKSPLLAVSGNPSSLRRPDYDFTVRANHLCAYRNGSVPYPMDFDAVQISAPVRCLTRRSVVNKLWKHYRTDIPIDAFFHTAGMHFDVRVPELWYDF